MASSWQPFSPARLSDHYRPHAPLNLGRPPRPGPRQPDCWRPGQRFSSPSVRVKPAQQEDTRESGNIGSSKQLKSKNNSGSSTKRKKQKANSLDNPNRAPLGKRQMGVINSIIRSEEQSVGFTKGNKNLRDHSSVSKMAEARPQETYPSETIDSSAADTVKTGPPTTKPPTTLPLRFLSSTPDEPEWSRTKIIETRLVSQEHMRPTIVPTASSLEFISSTADPNENDLSSTSTPTPKLRQKLDFGNRVDQCLLKMDKWADAWLSEALTTADPNPNPDNAWQSFEHCLSMPDILEDGEIVEYEEVPRCRLPATETHLEGPERQRGSGQSSKTLFDELSVESGETKGEKVADTLPTSSPIKLGKRSRSSTTFNSSTDESSRTDFRETSAAEFRSSSPEYASKRMKVYHIPSAATLREEARKRRLLSSSEGRTEQTR